MNEAYFFGGLVVGAMIVMAFNLVVIRLSNRWHRQTLALFLTDPDEFDQREDNPPWYVRFTDALLSIMAAVSDILRGVVRR